MQQAVLRLGDVEKGSACKRCPQRQKCLKSKETFCFAFNQIMGDGTIGRKQFIKSFKIIK